MQLLDEINIKVGKELSSNANRIGKTQSVEES